jgi:DNA polymerase III subunit epsilon
MKLNLKKPIAFFDLETTGISITHDRIVEIAVLKIHPNGLKETKTWLVNPTIPIPKEASDIHGIKDEDVADKPTFKEIAKQVDEFMSHCDLGGFNSNRFDIPLLVEELLRVDIDFKIPSRKFVDVQTIFHKMEQRNLTAAYKFYCEKSLENAHSAEADITATYEVLEAQIDRYEELQNDVNFLSEFSSHNNNVDVAGRIIYNDKMVEVFNFGKYKGKPVEEVLKTDPGYYGWLLKGDFSLHTKKVMSEIRLRSINK